MANFLSGILGLDAGKATQAAAQQNSKLFDQFGKTGQTYIDQGQQQSAGALNQGIAQYSPYQQTGTAANSMVANALGLNGPAGNTAATGAFQTSPGYQFNVDQQQQATQRGAAAGGMLASGNLLTALQDRSSGLANQEYGGWLDRLAQQSNQGLQAASGAAQGYGGLASLYQQGVGQRLDLGKYVTGGKAGANYQYGQGGEQNAAGLAALGQDLGGFLGQTKTAKKFLGFL
jgi:hypothetical protein